MQHLIEYKGLYNAITTGSHKTWKAFLFLIGSFSVVFVLMSWDVLAKDPSVFFYLHSTIVQGFLALIALLGTVCVYKLQLYENDIMSVRNRIKLPMMNFRGGDVEYYSPIDMMHAAEEFIKNDTTTVKNPQYNAIKTGLEEFRAINESKKELRTALVDFTFISFVNVGLSLLGILGSSALVSIKASPVVIGWAIISILLSVLSLKAAMGIVKTVLGYDYKLTI